MRIQSHGIIGFSGLAAKRNSPRFGTGLPTDGYQKEPSIKSSYSTDSAAIKTARGIMQGMWAGVSIWLESDERADRNQKRLKRAEIIKRVKDRGKAKAKALKAVKDQGKAKEKKPVD